MSSYPSPDEWKRLTNQLRRLLAQDGEVLRITRGLRTQMMAVDVETNGVVWGPMEADLETVRQWVKELGEEQINAPLKRSLARLRALPPVARRG